MTKDNWEVVIPFSSSQNQVKNYISRRCRTCSYKVLYKPMSGRNGLHISYESNIYVLIEVLNILSRRCSPRLRIPFAFLGEESETHRLTKIL